MDGTIPNPAPDLLAQFRNAVAADITTLSRLHHAELDDALLADLSAQGFPDTLGLKLTQPRSLEALAFMQQALADLAVPLSQVLQDELAADYAAIYLNHSYNASPYESVWLDDENLAMQAPMFQVREIYRRHGLGVADWRKRSEDHLVVEMQFIAWLMQSEQAEPLAEVARFMDDHLLRWLPKLGERIAKRCATPFYAAAAWLTLAYCDELRDLLATILDEPRPSSEDIEARIRPEAVQAVPVKFVPGVAPSW